MAIAGIIRIDATQMPSMASGVIVFSPTCRVPERLGLINTFRLFQAMDVLRELVEPWERS